MLYYGFNTFLVGELIILIIQAMHTPVCSIPKGRVYILYHAYKIIC